MASSPPVPDDEAMRAAGLALVYNVQSDGSAPVAPLL